MLAALAAGLATASDASPAGALGSATGTWRSSTAQAMSHAKVAATDETCRQVLRASVDGSTVRLRLSNVLSPTPLTLSAVTVARRTKAAAIDATTLRTVTVGGSRTVSLEPGADVVTDPVALPVRLHGDVVVSFAVRGSARLSEHETGAATGYCSGPGSGDLTTATGGGGFRATGRHGFVVDELSVEVRAGAPGSVLVIGDSLSDPRLPPDTYARWSDVLRSRLPADVPVANAAIDGNRVLLPGGFGPTVVQRFSRDVLARPGVGTLVILAGTNDVSSGATVQQLTDALSALADKAHARSMRVVLLTIPPAHKRTPDKEIVRIGVNSWIRATDRADVLVDADAVLRDPGQPNRLRPEYDRGDGLHLSVAGHRAVGLAVATALR